MSRAEEKTMTEHTNEWVARVCRLVYDREMTYRAAVTVVDAAMFGKGCLEGTIRKQIEEAQRDAGQDVRQVLP